MSSNNRESTQKDELKLLTAGPRVARLNVAAVLQSHGRKRELVFYSSFPVLPCSMWSVWCGAGWPAG